MTHLDSDNADIKLTQKQLEAKYKSISEAGPITLGTTTTVKFTSISEKPVTAKVDTGATTSSLHATNVKVHGNQVSFTCEVLSDNVITLDMAGSQNVVTSDNGGEARPIVKLDITINGMTMRDTVFNLNDRSQMELPVLIGENVLEAGHFVVDVSKDTAPEDTSTESNIHEKTDEIFDELMAKVHEAMDLHTTALEKLHEYVRTKI